MHINYPLEENLEEDVSTRILSAAEARYLVTRCGSTLSEFGCNSRVWMVSRFLMGDVQLIVAFVGRTESS